MIFSNTASISKALFNSNKPVELSPWTYDGQRHVAISQENVNFDCVRRIWYKTYWLGVYGNQLETPQLLSDWTTTIPTVLNAGIYRFYAYFEVYSDLYENSGYYYDQDHYMEVTNSNGGHSTRNGNTVDQADLNVDYSNIQTRVPVLGTHKNLGSLIEYNGSSLIPKGGLPTVRFGNNVVNADVSIRCIVN